MASPEAWRKVPWANIATKIGKDGMILNFKMPRLRILRPGYMIYTP